MRLVRRIFAPFRRTPLHPQWFCFRDESNWLCEAGSACRGVVVDVGCGRQRVRPYLLPQCSYVGLDYPQTAIALYSIRPDIFADGGQLPLLNECADTVLALEVLEHVADAEALVTEAARVLVPGGQFILSVPFLYPLHDAPHDYQRWTPFGLRHLLCTTGFEITSLETKGWPLATGVLLLNLALAKTVLELFRRRNPLALVACPVVALCILIANLLAWSFQWLDRDQEFMPFTCRVHARKADGVTATRSAQASAESGYSCERPATPLG